VNHKIVLLGIVAILASGCASESGTSSGQGVVVEDFSISDNTLIPEQEANLKVEIANYNTNPTDIETLEIFNKGKLKVENKQCSSESIRAAREDIVPRMSCSWTVKAPGEDFIEGFDSKPTPIKLRLAYSTSFENTEPLKIDYQELSNIKNSGETTITDSNGNIEITINGQTPTSQSSPNPLNFQIRNVGPGRVEGNYDLTYNPNDILEECPNEEEPVIENTVEYSCNLESGSTGTKNIFLTTSYKYIKSPNLDIQVVNNQ